VRFERRGRLGGRWLFVSIKGAISLCICVCVFEMRAVAVLDSGKVWKGRLSRGVAA
jgi:hypothetical protein